MARLLLCLLAITPAWGGEVFRCADGKGGFVLRDVPCTITQPSAAESAEPARPAVPPPRSAPAAGAPSGRRTAASPRTTARSEATPGRTSCLSSSGANAKIQRADQLAVELLWAVRVRNTCAQPASGLVTFTVYGSRALILESDSARMVMAAPGVETVQGMLRVSREKMRHMRRYAAQVSE